MIKQNIGLVQALIRITIGFVLVGYGIAKLSERFARNWPVWTLIAGGMKIGEGITRFCPVIYWFTRKEEDDKHVLSRDMYAGE
ncbi:DUF2892 domain-containing protein [Paenalkalicoccus suaedae]|uniref:DUF2892 domain-containing protein n=1 Tax=Paenalkalicoccus suaedae TaxID=2592382 RepID=A0A859FCY4_9BACI|nr:DUF2892 domain-containing protein [Paenalkalicoccus suaedae]QKS70434.1 DUF2892 domain-containing protein [Paenalkalicoccus suaedae]